ncbi:MAG TPA: DUF1489 domain-containing protein [Thermohalobaculum sp.]|nr:DUF1489 domain-containing protein [Thermohalobaculum sp.]
MPDQPEAKLHLIKLSVGTDSIEDLRAWQSARAAERLARGEDPRPRHVTRMWPKRGDELLAGGSIYWVIRGVVRVRQRIAALEEVIGEDGIRRCGIRLDPALIPTVPRPRSAFQGWRYLSPSDAPQDIGAAPGDEPGLPPGLREALARFGVLPG